MQTHRDPKQTFLWRHAALGVLGLTALAGLGGILTLTGCIRVEVGGFSSSSFNSSSSKNDRVKLTWREVDGKLVGEWETSDQYFKSSSDGSYYMEQTTDNSREIVYGGNAVGFPKEHFGSGKPENAPILLTRAEDAGTIEWAGQRVGNKGSGSYTFTPNPEFLAAIRPHASDTPQLRDLHQLAQRKVDRSYFSRAAGMSGGKVSSGDVTTLVNYGIKPEALDEWAAARPGLSIPQLISLRNNGVQPASLKEFSAAQPGISVEEVIRYRHNGLNPDYVQAWTNAGFALKPEELIRLRQNGVPIDFAQALKRGGFAGSVEDIIRLRNNGVPPDFYAGAKSAMPKLSDAEIVRLRQNGVSVDYLQGWKEIGYEFSTEEIIRLRNHGVQTDYARQANPPGRKLLDAAALIDARNRGLSAETLRKLRE